MASRPINCIGPICIIVESVRIFDYNIHITVGVCRRNFPSCNIINILEPAPKFNRCRTQRVHPRIIRIIVFTLVQCHCTRSARIDIRIAVEFVLRSLVLRTEHKTIGQ